MNRGASLRQAPGAGFRGGQPSEPPGVKQGLEIGQRFAVAAAWFTAFILFVVVFAVLSFTYHSKYDSYTVAVIGLFFAALYGFPTGNVVIRQTLWRWMPLASCGFSVLLAVWLGETNYHWYQQHYFDIEYGHLHNGVLPTNSGFVYKDAAVVRFSADSRLDNTRVVAMQKDGHRYCVAPVISSTGTVTEGKSYNFWAVGLDCCNEQTREFSCGSGKLKKTISADQVEATKIGILATYEGDATVERRLFLNAVRMANARFALPSFSRNDAIILLNWSVDPFQDKDDFRSGGLLFFWVWFVVSALVYAGLAYFVRPGKNSPAHPHFMITLARTQQGGRA
mmetsp:Transcript_22181/g.55924  ORF Transcript_22181/g.55924 Transcript_22181/m.55924 type:complete len:337 (-) Transcript_22181:91-1101(-)|eukprot:CAMPEP_0178982004 /NCGR_PEP_ID=MMETSP0795-20121207/260_1 /TAXON_ID=88552 /ORGANISM="Amoebophrya sp., Strain Ameob2" /LENGTH=336 /DNA_ID=CAMNT_0020672611 /DNA_START=91 /DNA_END=1101 /DNA_ORIENTATION=+